MDDILIRDIKELKFLTNEEVNYLYNKRPNVLNYMIVSFQESLRNCLLEYLNTPFSMGFRASVSISDLKKKYLRLGLETKALDFNLKIKDLPAIISYSYPQLKQLLKKINRTKEESSIELAQLEEDYYTKFPVLENFVDFTKKKLSKYLKTAIIHGSCADLELTPFSDLDTFLIINEDTVNSEKLLIEFKSNWADSLKYLYRFDSLQHHNHMVATEYDLDFFEYHWLPPQIFQKSKLICGNNIIKFKLNKSIFLI